MNALPQAIANGRNQNGTIAGKLNGTIAAQTPTGWRTVSASTLRDTSSRIRPCIVVGHRAGGLDHLDHARHLGAGVADRLAHLGRDRAGEVLAAGVEPLAQREQPAGALDHATPPATRAAPRARPSRRRRGRPPTRAAPGRAPRRWPGW